MTNAVHNDIRAAAHEWRARNAAGDLTQEERVAFDRWVSADPRHGAVYAEAEVLWRALGDVDYAPEADRPLLSEQIRSFFDRACGRISLGLQSVIGRTLAGATAAVCLAVVFVTIQSVMQPSSAPMETVYQTAKSEIRELALDDGTMITLGADSHLAVAMSAEARSVRLDAGEAYFDVAEDAARPFEVLSGATRVRAVGTAFDVRKKAGALSISVAEGVVEVSHLNGGEAAPLSADAVRVTAGRRVAVSEATGLGAVVEAPASDLAAWRSGLLVYYGASLEEVVSDANRYYGRPIRIDAEAARLKLSGSFRADDIDMMLLAMSEALSVEIADHGPAGVMIKAAR